VSAIESATAAKTAKVANRWIIAVAGIVIQACLGTVYAWSVFPRPLNAAHGWAMPSITVAFTIAIFVMAFSAAVGGYILDSKGPRVVATVGGAFFGAGILVTGYAAHIGSLPLIYCGYGLLCGIGLGFGYITPIATLVKWFPDKRGLITGLAVMGFGLGSGMMAWLAPGMIAKIGVPTTLYIFGGVFFAAVVAAAQLMVAPPAGYSPPGWTQPAGTSAASGMTLGEALRTKYFYLFWVMLFLNVTAGVAVISQASPMAQEFMKNSTIPVDSQAAAAGSLLLLFAIFNGLGRLIWASLSDKIGRRTVFFILFASQAILFFVLYIAPPSLPLFVILICYQYACLGGGFATMPAYAADTFGTKYAGRIYGWMLTAWGIAAVAGPTVYARVYQSSGSYTRALLYTAVMFVFALLIPALSAPKKAGTA